MAEKLLLSKRFLPLFATQGLGAVNDNLFKNALVVLALFRLPHAGPILVALAGGVFILPYALFSATAGQLADSREKSRLILYVKFWELGLALLAAAGFLTGSFAVLMAVLAGLGLQATFFSPLKYGILPDHLRLDELVAGNGLIEAGTFISILAGTVAGGALILIPHGPAVVSATVIAVALLGIAAAAQIPLAPAAAPDLKPGWNLAAETTTLVRQAALQPPVWFAILGISWFWAVGATLLAEFPTIARVTLQSNGQVITAMLAAFAIGVGVGSLAVVKLLHGQASLRYVAYAGFGVSFFTADFAFTAAHAGHIADLAALLHSPQGWHMLADLLVLAAFGGAYSVPLYVLLQEASQPSHRARMIAANNVMNALASVAGAVSTAVLEGRGFSGGFILALAAAANFVVSVMIMRKLRKKAVLF